MPHRPHNARGSFVTVAEVSESIRSGVVANAKSRCMYRE